MKRFVHALIAVVALAMPVAAAEIGDDGLHKAAWMRDTFKDLHEDLAEGKRLVVMVEQRGCIYCQKMHEQVYSDPELPQFVGENFFVVQMNLHGSDTAIDFDGEELEQSALMRKWGILFTPSVIFFPEDVPSDTPAPQVAVAIMPGSVTQSQLLTASLGVHEKRYLIDNGEDFQRYHARRISERNNGNAD
mgnify:CR=1 FL=1